MIPQGYGWLSEPETHRRCKALNLAGALENRRALTKVAAHVVPAVERLRSVSHCPPSWAAKCRASASNTASAGSLLLPPGAWERDARAGGNASTRVRTKTQRGGGPLKRVHFTRDLRHDLPGRMMFE